MEKFFQGGFNIKVEIEKHSFIKKLTLNSEVLVSVGDRVTAETVVAIYKTPQPRQFVLSAFSVLPYVHPNKYNTEWLIKPGDSVEFSTPLVSFTPTDPMDFSLIKDEKARMILLEREKRVFKSPITGIILEIVPKTGIILVTEDIDYSETDITVDLHAKTHNRGRRLARSIKVMKGEFVEKRQSLAVIEPGVLGLLMVTVKAPIAGIIKDLDIRNGKIIITREFIEHKIVAGIHGTVTDIDKGGITISSHGRKINGICGIGAESFGQLKVITTSESDPVIPDDLNDSDQGKIIAGGSFISLSALERAAEIGINGVIVGGVDHLDLSNFINNELAIASTGNENIPFPLIITEAFGKNPMNSELFEFFKHHENEYVYMNGKTQIRAGVIRPEIIVLSESHDEI